MRTGFLGSSLALLAFAAACSSREPKHPLTAGELRTIFADSLLRSPVAPDYRNLPDSVFWILQNFTADPAINQPRYDSVRTEQGRRQADSLAAAQVAQIPARTLAIIDSVRAFRYERFANPGRLTCAAPPTARVERMVREHPGWEDEAFVSIICRVVSLGMTPEQVRVVLGAPREVTTGSTGRNGVPVTEETWRYRGRRLVFVDGKLDVDMPDSRSN